MKSPLLKDKIPILEFWDYWIDYWSKDCEGWEGGYDYTKFLNYYKKY